MSVPKPTVALQDQCSVIADDTLYVYSPSAFQALPLKKKAKWSQLPNGVSVTGAVCTLGLENGPGSGDALWVVGGSSNKSTSQYPGLQRYSFTKKSWKTISPLTKVTQNRRNHGAAFLKSSGSILLYGGSQDSTSQRSIQTFVIQTTSPFNVVSYTAQNTPALSPLLLSWNDTAAITLGGDSSKDIYMFNENNATSGWTPYGTTLSTKLKSSTDQQATLIKGSDGSKVLELYDMSSSPNVVSGIVLQDADGNPAQTGQIIGQTSGGSGRRLKRKRALSLDNWPSYDNTNAPAFKRSGFSIAQNPDSGLVAMVGGNDQHPLSLFNEEKNSWVDNSKFFGNSQSVVAQATHASTSSATSSATSTPTPPPPVADHPKTSVILGATLGSICGLILILVILLLILRYRRRRNRRAAAAAEDNEKRRLSFADRGDPFSMEEDKSAKRNSRNLTPGAIAAANNKSKAGHMRRSDSKGSDSSTRQLVPKHDPLGRPGYNMEMTGLGPGVPPVPTIVSPDGTSKSSNSTTFALPKRSSGWSRYFSGTPSANPSITPAGAAAVAKAPGNTGSMLSSNSGTSSHDCSSHGPVEIPPLQLGQEFNGGRISRVVTGSPPRSSAGEVRRTGTMTSVVPSSRDSRPWTVSSMNSSGQASSIDEAIFTGHQHSENNRWTPMDRSNWTGPTLRDTVTSSVYTHTPKNSETLPAGLNTIIEQNDPSTPKTKQPPRISDPDTWPRPPKSLIIPEDEAAPGVQEIMRPTRSHDGVDDEPSTPTATTAIPIPASTAMQYTVKKPPKTVTNSDLSWLNLGPVQSK
ncbi:MAG: hypothetical protein M1828_002779 [Chrysothrix sp. TS-e1954]|nr:MAG: hypothetical protein M1828_002779 [Chrysothrix sp. TS-e1954]